MTYDEWMNEQYENLAAVAHTLWCATGTAHDNPRHCQGYEWVDEAVRRTIESAQFRSTVDPKLWWPWHVSALRSVISNARRGDATLAMTVDWRAITGVGEDNPLPRLEDRPPQVDLDANWETEYSIREVGRCVPRRGACDKQAMLRVERGTDLRYITRTRTIERRRAMLYVLGCRDGHRQYITEERAIDLVERAERETR